MTTLLSAILTAFWLWQVPTDRTAVGTVVDEQGKPVANVQVALYAPPVGFGTGQPALAETTTDAAGRFAVKEPPHGRVYTDGIYVWAYRQGFAISAVGYQPSQPHRIVLHKADTRVITVTGPDGKAIAGASISPKAIFTSSEDDDAVLPTRFAGPLTVICGFDGKASITYLKSRDRLTVARVTADLIGSQDIPARTEIGDSSITVKLEKTERLAGRIVAPDGKGIAGQPIEIWKKGSGSLLVPGPVEFKTGAVRTDADGTFRTPANLLVGSTYRVFIRERGKETVISDWVKAGDTPATLPPLELRPLRTLKGTVVERTGKPLANIEVFQAGDGPERTAVTTRADGRFALGGFPGGPVFVFARGDGFRFHGQLINTSESGIKIELTRTGEPPARTMRKLPDPIPIDESRKLVHRLIDPWWDAAVAQKDEGAKYFALRFLIPADPVAALEKLSAVKFPTEKSRSLIQGLIARSLARRDFEEAESVAESITDAAAHAGTLARMADLIPDAERARKLAILDRAGVQVRATTDPAALPYQAAQVASRLWDLGEFKKAKELCALGLSKAKQSNDRSARRRSFLATLASLDLPAALDLIRTKSPDRTLELMSIAFGLNWDNPADAERFMNEYPLERSADWLSPIVTWKVAQRDPRRAQNLVAKIKANPQQPERLFCLALGAQRRNETIARQAIREGLRALDEMLPHDLGRVAQISQHLLPIAELIDPGLVPEVFWRTIAARPPLDNPRADYVPTYPIRYYAWYDRDVAAALFEPARRRLMKVTDAEAIDAVDVFEAWSLMDPRAAVARLEQLPIKHVNANNNQARIYSIEKLALDHEDRWIKTWSRWAPIFDAGIRDALWNPY